MTTESVSLNPMGLALAQMLEAALMPTIKSLVAAAVTEAQTGKLAGVMLDDEFDARVQGLIATAFRRHIELEEDRVNELIASKLSDHTYDYVHDDFQTKNEVKALIEDAMDDADITPVDADNDDFRSAVCAAVRNSLG